MTNKSPLQEMLTDRNVLRTEIFHKQDELKSIEGIILEELAKNTSLQAEVTTVNWAKLQRLCK